MAIDINLHRRDRLDSQFDSTSLPIFEFAIDTLILSEKSFIIYSMPKYDTFEIGYSLPGEEKTFTSDDDWNEGTATNVTVSSGTLTGGTGGGTWVSPELYWSPSSLFTTVDNFNTLNFNGTWEEDPEGNNDGSVEIVYDTDLVANGHKFLQATGSSSSDDIKYRKNFLNTITIRDKLYVLHRGNATISFYSGTETLELTVTTTGNPTSWTLSEFDTSSKSGTTVSRVFIEDEGTYYDSETGTPTWGSPFTAYDSWNYRQKITITENSGSSLTDYQVKLTIDTASLISAGKMQSDGSDIRFTNSSGTELDYWIESGINTSSTVIWVKVDSIPASSSTDIYMFYGNSSASAVSSGDNTFEFFDDFEGTSLDTSKWTIKEGTEGTGIKIENGKLILDSTSSGEGALVYIYSTNNIYSGTRAVRIKSKFTCPGTEVRTGFYGWRGDYSISADNNYFQLDGCQCDLSGWKSAQKDDSNAEHNYEHGTRDENYHVRELRLTSSESEAIVVDDTTDTGATQSVTLSNVPQKITIYSNGNSGGLQQYVDWVFIRKYASSEPTYSTSSEESLPSSETYYFFDLDAIWLEDTSRQTTWEELNLTYSGSVTVDILDASDDSVLQSGLSGSTITLKNYSNLEGKNLKIRLNIPELGTVDSLTVKWKPDLAGDNRGMKTQVVSK